MVYEIVNPSDAYTMEAGELAVAAAACVLLGHGKYALDPIEEGGTRVPLFLFGGHDEWFQKHCGFTIEGGGLDAFLREHGEEVAVALDSVLIGGRSDRKTYHDGLALITDEANRQAWRDRWHDARPPP